MKSLALLLLFLISPLAAQAQGTVQFRNFDATTGLNAPVYYSWGDFKLSGDQYIVELVAWSSVSNIVNSVPISVGTTGFATGIDAGYFDGGTLTINGIPGGAMAFLQVRVWNTAYGATYADAHDSYFNASDKWGQSPIFYVTLGDPNASPPTPPAALIGLVSFYMAPSLSQPSPPTLFFIADAGNMVLSWGIYSNPYILQSTTDLASGVWSTNLPSPVVTNGLATVTIRATGAQQFFRLSR